MERGNVLLAKYEPGHRLEYAISGLCTGPTPRALPCINDALSTQAVLPPALPVFLLKPFLTIFYLSLNKYFDGSLKNNKKVVFAKTLCFPT